MDKQKYTDKSYCQISFSRIQCTNKKLYGSKINHNSYISLKINNSEMIEDNLHQTHYFERDKLIEVSMSSSQFAELITTLNFGTGTPCTLDYIRDIGSVYYKQPYETSINKKLGTTIDIEKERFKKKVFDIQDYLKNILSKKSIGKKDKDELKLKIDILIRDCIDNYKFAEQQFRKQMETHIVECKTEIESTLTQITTKLGETQINNLDQIGE